MTPTRSPFDVTRRYVLHYQYLICASQTGACHTAVVAGTGKRRLSTGPLKNSMCSAMYRQRETDGQMYFRPKCPGLFYRLGKANLIGPTNGLISSVTNIVFVVPQTRRWQVDLKLITVWTGKTLNTVLQLQQVTL